MTEAVLIALIAGMVQLAGLLLAYEKLRYDAKKTASKTNEKISEVHDLANSALTRQTDRADNAVEKVGGLEQKVADLETTVRRMSAEGDTGEP